MNNALKNWIYRELHSTTNVAMQVPLHGDLMFLLHPLPLPHRRRLLEIALYSQRRSVRPFLRQHFGKNGKKLKFTCGEFDSTRSNKQELLRKAGVLWSASIPCCLFAPDWNRSVTSRWQDRLFDRSNFCRSTLHTIIYILTSLHDFFWPRLYHRIFNISLQEALWMSQKSCRQYCYKWIVVAVQFKSEMFFGRDVSSRFQLLRA